jgi:hypothetical protein
MTRHKKHKSFALIVGKVWDYGSKIYYDPSHGKYLQFAMKMRRLPPGFTTKVKIYVNWYQWTFFPQKGDWLECIGDLGAQYKSERIDSGSLCITLMCWGDTIKKLDLPD